MELIIVSVYDDPRVSRSVLEAGADGFVAKRAIATDLLAAADAVLAGNGMFLLRFPPTERTSREALDRRNLRP